MHDESVRNWHRIGLLPQRLLTAASISSTASALVDLNVAIDGATESFECERVLQECRNHMQMLGQNQVLLSMLGLALSLPARAYMRCSNLGLKHFLK